MINDVIIPARYVYVQSAEPSDKTEGKLWYSTSNNQLYTSNGSAYVQLDTDLTNIYEQQLQQDLNILVNSVASSSTLEDYDEMFVDIFSDSGGASDTVDTGNTTAIFDTNKYKNGGEAGDLTHAYLTGAGGSQTTTKGMGFTPYQEGYILSSVTKYASSGATGVNLCTSANGSGVVSSATFSGNTATFGTPPSLTKDQEYFIIATPTGSSIYHPYNNSGGTYPFGTGGSGTTYQFTSSSNDGNRQTANGFVTHFTGINLSQTPEDKVVQTNKVDLVSAPTGYYVYSKNSTAGSGSINFDISFDNGSTWEEDKEFGQEYAYTGSGTEMILKIKLDGIGSGNTSEVNNYGVMIT